MNGKGYTELGKEFGHGSHEKQIGTTTVRATILVGPRTAPDKKQQTEVHQNVRGGRESCSNILCAEAPWYYAKSNYSGAAIQEEGCCVIKNNAAPPTDLFDREPGTSQTNSIASRMLGLICCRNRIRRSRLVAVINATGWHWKHCRSFFCLLRASQCFAVLVPRSTSWSKQLSQAP